MKGRSCSQITVIAGREEESCSILLITAESKLKGKDDEKDAKDSKERRNPALKRADQTREDPSNVTAQRRAGITEKAHCRGQNSDSIKIMCQKSIYEALKIL